MTSQYTIQARENFVYIRYNDDVTVELTREILDSISKDGQIIYPRRIYDIRGMEFKLSADEMRTFATIGVSRDVPEGRIAIIADKDIAYGTARIFSAHRETDHTVVRVFRDRDKAMAWIIED